MADTSVRIIVGLKDEFSRQTSRVINSLEQIRRNVFSLNTAIAAFGVGAMAKGFIDTAAQMDKTLVLLKRLEGSGEAARASFDWMLKFGQDNAAVANIEQFQQAFVRLKVAGLDPAGGSMQALTDAVAAFGGSSDDLQKASVAVFQMAGKGAINMEELRQQLGERVPTAIKLMAKELNISVEQLNKFTETSVLTGDKARKALEAMFRGFEKEYGGASKDLASTWTGMINQLGVKWELFKIKVMDSGPFKKMKETMEELITWLDSPEGMRKTEEVAKKVAEGFLAAARAANSLVKNLDEITDSIGGLVAKWNSMDPAMRDFLMGTAGGYMLTKNPWAAMFTGAAWATEGARERKAAAMAPAPPMAKFKVAGAGADTGAALARSIAQMEALDLARAKALKANPKLSPAYTYDATDWKAGDGGAKAEAAAKKAAAALAAFQNAVRDVNKEFAEVTGDKAAVWLAQWEDKFADLQARLLAGKTGAEQEAALARLQAADAATRKAISAGYSSMVEAREDLEKFKNELAALETGDPKEDDRRELALRLQNLQKVGLITPGDASQYTRLKEADWAKDDAKEALETKRNFYQEYIRISGEGMSVIEDGIREQAQVFLDAKVNEEHVAKWVEYQKLQYAKDWASGAKRALDEYVADTADMASSIEEVVSGSFRGMEDALVNFVQTGKLEFSDLADSIIADMARIAIQQSITGPLASGMQSLIEGLLPAAVGVAGASVMPSGGTGLYYSRGHHGGGIVGSEHSFIRAVPEATFANAPRFHDGLLPGEFPAILKQGEGVFTEGQMRALGGPANIQVNIVESPGKGGQIEQRDDNGTLILDVFFDQLDARMASNINNGRGATTAAISKTFGLNRSRGSMR